MTSTQSIEVEVGEVDYVAKRIKRFRLTPPAVRVCLPGLPARISSSRCLSRYRDAAVA